MGAKNVLFGLLLFGLPVALTRRLWDNYDMRQADEYRNYQDNVVESSKSALSGSTKYYSQHRIQ